MLRFWCCLSSNTRRSRRNAKNRQRNADADTEEEDAEKEEAEDSEDEPEEEEDEEDEEDGDNDQDEDDEDDEDEESAEDVVTPGQRQIRSQEGASEAITTRAKASGNSEDLEEEEDVVAGTYNGVDYSPATAEQQWACCTIQRVVRGYLGRLFVQQLWHEAFALVNKFWLRKLRRWQDEKMRKQAIIEARQQVRC